MKVTVNNTEVRTDLMYDPEKHVGHFNIPLSGKIIRRNENVIENPRLINTDPYGEGWLIEIEADDLESQVQNFIQGKQSVLDWFESEFEKMNDKGWLAQD